MRNLVIRALALVLTGMYTGGSGAAEHEHAHHEAEHTHIGNEPIGVMGAHAHAQGDRFHLSSWLSKDWTPAFSSSVRLNTEWWGNLEGTDKKLPLMGPSMVPTANPDLRAGRRFDLLVGASISPTSGILQGHRFAVEYGRPVYQNLDGPQLETDWTVTVGWQWAL